MKSKNNQRYWFRAKNYGYGWYPASIEGWIVLAIYIILITILAFNFGQTTQGGNNLLFNFLAETFLLTVILVLICIKTGEKARWKWGKNDK
jgi:hypothetical protein